MKKEIIIPAFKFLIKNEEEGSPIIKKCLLEEVLELLIFQKEAIHNILKRSDAEKMNLTEAVRNALSGLVPSHMVESLSPKVAERLRKEMQKETKERLKEKGRLRWKT